MQKISKEIKITFEFAGFSSYLHVGFELSRVKLQ